MARAAVSRRRLTHRSASLFDRALDVLVDGVSSPSRGRANYDPYPRFLASGRGSRVIDVDGNEYVDLMLAYGSLIHGHAHPRLVRALTENADRGALLAAASELEVEVAEAIRRMIPGAERVRFTSTGTEAALAALRILRGFTGKKKVLKFEGHYHGWSDAYAVSSNFVPDAVLGHYRNPIPIPDSSGLTQGAIQDTLVAPWNDLDIVGEIVKNSHRDLAAIVTEPVMANMGVIPPRQGFLRGLREIADEYEVLLYMDETVTGFRLGTGGAQERFGVRADLMTFGKALGAGFPVAAVAGRADIMAVLAGGRVLHYGTQNANQLLLAVVRESLDMLNENEGAAFRQLDELGGRLADGIRVAIRKAGVPALVQNVGPMFQIMFLRDGFEDYQAIRDMREFGRAVDRTKFRLFAHLLMDEGVYLSPAAGLHSVLSSVHDEEDAAEILDAVDRSLEATKLDEKALPGEGVS